MKRKQKEQLLILLFVNLLLHLCCLWKLLKITKMENKIIFKKILKVSDFPQVAFTHWCVLRCRLARFKCYKKITYKKRYSLMRKTDQCERSITQKLFHSSFFTCLRLPLSRLAQIWCIDASWRIDEKSLNRIRYLIGLKVLSGYPILEARSQIWVLKRRPSEQVNSTKSL